MNKIISTIILIFLVQFSFSQTYPETFNYQAIARNDDGSPIANEEIVVEVTILTGTGCDENSGSCNISWQELHFPTTNAFGLFSINIGSGQNTFAGSETNFSNINWNDFTSGNYFLQLRVDFGSSGYGNGLIDMGVVAFQSVPYSFSSEKAIDIERTGGKVPFNLTELLDINISTLATNEVLSWNGTNWVNATVTSSGPVALTDLTDVTISGSATNQVLTYNGTNWTNSNISLTLNQLSNVNTTPSSGDFFTYNGTNWTSSTLSITDIPEFNISSQTVGQALVWDGTNWTNQDVSAGGSVWTDDGTYIYYNSGKNVGIGTATPSEAFQILLTGDDGIMINGTFSSSGVVTSLGSGTRMTFFPSKSAFRVGTVDGTQWDGGSTGNYSFAAGRNNIASGTYSTAFGYNNSATGSASLSIGTTNISVGLNSFVCGTGNNTSPTIDGDNSIVAGSTNEGYSINSLTIGTGNSNNGINSIVFGENSKTDANGSGAIAGGNGTNARGTYSAALGMGNTAQAYASLVIGRYNNITGDQLNWVGTDPAFVVGNGTGTANRNNAMIVRKNGDIVNETGVYATAANPTKSNKIDNFNDILKLDAIAENKAGITYYGFSAEQVQQFFPDLVTDFNAKKAINYTGFIPMMIETIKEQQNEIENLRHKNQELKNKLENIEERLSVLEK